MRRSLPNSSSGWTASLIDTPRRSRSWRGLEIRRLSPPEVLALHDRIIVRTGGQHGLADLGALVVMLGRPFAATPTGDFYPSLYDKAAALCHGLTREHPFKDGNHRTGVAAAVLFLEFNGHRCTARPKELVAFVRGVAGENHRIDETSEWLRAHTEPENRESKERANG